MAGTWSRATQRRARPQADYGLSVGARRNNFAPSGHEGTQRGFPRIRKRSTQIPESAEDVTNCGCHPRSARDLLLSQPPLLSYILDSNNSPIQKSRSLGQKPGLVMTP